MQRLCAEAGTGLLTISPSGICQKCQMANPALYWTIILLRRRAVGKEENLIREVVDLQVLNRVLNDRIFWRPLTHIVTPYQKRLNGM